MNRERYLQELGEQLGEMPERERDEILADYEEHFRAGVDAGKSEEEIARSLGSPRQIGKSFRIDAMLDESQGRSAAAVLRAVFASLSLGFFNVVVVLGPFAAVAAIVVALWAAAVSIGLSGVGVVVAAIAHPFFPGFVVTGGLHPLFLVPAGIAVAAIGLLTLIGMWQLTKWVVRIAGKYVQLNVRIVTNRR